MTTAAKPAPQQPAPIHVFRAGRHVTAAGEEIEFTEADLAAMAAAYDPALHEAPFVIGHPKTDAPAYGWGAGFKAEGKNLYVLPHQVQPEFAEMVNSGAFKKRSLKFYRPTDPGNPKPGVWYPQHVGFLGATPPAIKGLKEVQFSDSADLVEVEFGEWESRTIARIFRRLREFLIGQHGQEVADKVIDGYDVDALAVEAGRDCATHTFPSPAFAEGEPISSAETTDKEIHVTPEEQAAVEAENARLREQVAAAEARQKEADATARRTAAVQFCEGLIESGQVLPAEKDTVVGVLELAAASQPVEFGEGDGKKSEAPLVRLQDFLKALPKRVEFREVGGHESGGKPVEFSAPSGYGVDPAQLEIHTKALAYQAAHPDTDYVAAVRAVS